MAGWISSYCLPRSPWSRDNLEKTCHHSSNANKNLLSDSFYLNKGLN